MEGTGKILDPERPIVSRTSLSELNEIGNLAVKHEGMVFPEFAVALPISSHFSSATTKCSFSRLLEVPPRRLTNVVSTSLNTRCMKSVGIDRGVDNRQSGYDDDDLIPCSCERRSRSAFDGAAATWLASCQKAGCSRKGRLRGS